MSSAENQSDEEANQNSTLDEFTTESSAGASTTAPKIDEEDDISVFSSSIDQDLIPETDPETDQFILEGIAPEQFDIPSKPARYFLAESAISNKEITVSGQESRLNKYLDFLNAISAGGPESASSKDVMKYFVYLGQQEGRAKGTLDQHRSTISQFHGFLEEYDNFESPQVKSRKISSIDCESLTDNEHTFQRESISREEIDQLYEAAKSYRDELMARVLYEMGLRNEDVRKLKVGNINFEEKFIKVEERKNGNTDKIPVRDDLLIRLDHFIKSKRDSYKGSEEHDYVFPSPKGGCLNSASLTTIIKKMADRAGIQKTIGRTLAPSHMDCEYLEYKRVTPHTLRHSIVTHLAEKELSNDMISYLTGHESDAIEDYKHLNHDTAYDLIRDTIR